MASFLRRASARLFRSSRLSRPHSFDANSSKTGPNTYAQSRYATTRHDNTALHQSTERTRYQSQSTKRPKQYRAKIGAAVFAAGLVPVSKSLSDEFDTTTELSSDGISFDEVQKHVSEDDCWVIIEGRVYDLTQFIESHPGGAQAILSVAGTDASELFNTLHPSNALEGLPLKMCIGSVDPDSIPIEIENDVTPENERLDDQLDKVPDPDGIFLLQDYEYWAERLLSPKAWAYYRSAADEEKTFWENRNAFERYFLRPRILRGQQEGNLDTDIVGIPTSMPIFMAPTAMAKLGHPLGEINLTRAAGELGVVQAISSNSSCSVEEIFDAASEGQPLIFQLYLNKDRHASKALIQKVERLGAKAIIFTVDVAWASKRTLDVRHSSSTMKRSPKSTSTASSSVASAIGGHQDRNLTWKDISFIRENTTVPIIVKGVQSVEDVVLCVEHGVEGVILSNHGGRQADYAPAPIDILYEVRTLRPDLFDKTQIMIDGGIRSGADVVKALALGAKSVGIGRPLLYANGVHGQEGVSRVLQILREEITNTMRNIGVSRIEDLKPEMVGPAGPWVGANRPLYASAPTSKSSGDRSVSS